MTLLTPKELTALRAMRGKVPVDYYVGGRGVMWIGDLPKKYCYADRAKAILAQLKEEKIPYRYVEFVDPRDPYSNNFPPARVGGRDALDRVGERMKG